MAEFATEIKHPTTQFGLLGTRRLLPLFITQFFGAFNDNVYKQALLLIFVFSAIADAYDTNLLNNFAAGLFILPFFLLSATSGALADSYDKAKLVRYIKATEILIAMLVAVALVTQNLVTMLAVLFLYGAQSTFFGPIKFALLPQQLHPSELVGGNAMIEMGTFVAILLGTIVGGVLGNSDLLGDMSQVNVWVSITVIMTAIVGFVACLQIAPAPPAQQAKINWNPVTETVNLIKLTMERKAVFRSVLGVSWFWLLGSVFLTQVPNLTKEYLYGDGTVVTALLVVFTVAIAIGSLICERMSGRKIEIGLVPLGALGMSIWGIDAYFSISAIEPVPLRSAFEFLGADGIPRLLADLTFLGISAGVFVVPMQALIQNRTPPGKVARVIAGNNVINSLAMVLG
ncbi:MAG: MFS transporter, partial [Pseudomonadales bacterium]|nr:MFS transporter [Pseudomonadales bacterium]